MKGPRDYCRGDSAQSGKALAWSQVRPAVLFWDDRAAGGRRGDLVCAHLLSGGCLSSTAAVANRTYSWSGIQRVDDSADGGGGPHLRPTGRAAPPHAIGGASG